MAELKTKKLNELRSLCKIAGLATAGKKAELIDRLHAHTAGQSDRWVGKLTACKVCGARVMVSRTITQSLDDNRTLVTRYVRCQGRHRHTYPLKEVVTGDHKP